MPPFTEIPIDYTIRVISVGQTPEVGRHERGEETAALELESADSDGLPPADDRAFHYETASPAPDADAEPPATSQRVTVGRLRAARQVPVSVKLSDLLVNAVEMMTEKSFDHLAVLDDDGNLRGSISWQEIGASNHDANALVKDAAVQKVRSVRTDDLLTDCAQVVMDHGFVFVLNPDGSLSGMVTQYDLAHKLLEEMTPYAFIEEVEKRLRRKLLTALQKIKETLGHHGTPSDPGRIQKLLDDKTIFNEYVELLRRTNVWNALGWKFPQDSFVNRIDNIRKIRNDFLHFHTLAEEVRAAQVEEIENVLKALRRVDPPN